MSVFARLLFSTALFVAAGFSQAVTYSEHIAPLLYANCVKCHRPNQVAPFSLLTYDDARRHGRDLAIQTQSRYMPPWKPEPGWVAYRDERRLSTDQIALIKRWVDDGMPPGDPSRAPASPVFNDDWQLGKPDLILEMPKTFDVPAEGPDVYRNFVIPSGVTEDKYVRAIEVKPLSRTVVHHILFSTDSTGSARALDGGDGQPGFPGFGSLFTLGDPLVALNGGLGGWVPGQTPAFLPDGLGLPLPARADVLLQTHFHPDGLPHKEKTVLGFYFGPKPDRLVTQIQAPAFFGIRANIDIPAGESSYKVRGSYTLPADVYGVGVSAHAHYLAKEAKLTATLPSGEVRILLWIKQWDFNWQDQYVFQDLVALPRGTRLDGELTYDNSVNNYRNPNTPPKRVRWGENSTDEMGSLILTVTPNKANDIDALRAGTIAYLLSPVPLVGNRPLLVSSGIVDGASAQPGAVSPGKIVVLYGSRIGPATLTGSMEAGGGGIASNLGGTQVLFDGVPAPLLYASGEQVAAIVPYAVDGRSGTQIQVKNGSLSSDTVAIPVRPAGPSIFSVNLSGTGPAAVLNEDGRTVNSAADPAPRASVISIFVTGEGQTMPAGVDGQRAGTLPLPKPVLHVTARVDGQAAEVLYAGGAPGEVAGLMQVNVRIPAGVSTGVVAVEIQVGDATSQPGTTIVVQ